MSSGVIASFSIDSREILDQPANNFTFTLPQSLMLPQDRYEMCLARGMMFYAWYNFIATVPIDFTFDGGAFSIPSGNYSILTLEAKIKEIVEGVGSNPDDFNMSKDYPSGKIRLDLLNGTTFNPLSEALAKMIGFPQNIVVPSGITYGVDYPDFEGENQRIFITNSIVAGNYNYINQNTSRYIYEVKPPEQPAFSQFDVIDTPEDFVWFETNTNKIYDMTIQVVNQDGFLVDLNETPVKFWFLVRPKPNNIVQVFDSVKNPVSSAP